MTNNNKETSKKIVEEKNDDNLSVENSKYEDSLDLSEEALEDYIKVENTDNNLKSTDQKDYLDKIEKLEERYFRLQADYDNYRKRTQKEHIQVQNRANKEIMLAILPVIDNFERALASADAPNDAFVKGVDMVYKQLLDELLKQGLCEILAQGEVFDPNYHNAVAQLASDSESGTIIEVYQKGYSLNNEVIRPSMVVVAE